MKSNWFYFFRFIKDILSPFEILYLSICVATLDHSIWSASFLFEGNAITWSTAWWVGFLIALSVDAGMLIISRFLQNSISREETIALVVSFVLCAIASFYFQLTFMLNHAPALDVSAGVSTYWKEFLKPLMDARIVLLPLALPVLATSYTIVRIFHKRQAIQQRESQIEIMGTGDSQSDLLSLIDIVATAPLELPANKRIIELPYAKANLENLTFWWEATNKTYGPYTSRSRMVASMRRVGNKKLLLPERIENDNDK